ncbi:LCCL domain-containing protein, putative [Plasmodium gallinaceum]|uniref:LCCL domain-containing protein, putative n=1 Tax=Plasmodium gallinaceum TaxID=5849 RepID=A0A1J1GVU0_PLAGA|nr:LCCL domain-containing protein, putative [Plasmodium gallinaceum]CRG96582.1 LCCL domain-containing protein, putative [Plasmodium gallinaceum]
MNNFFFSVTSILFFSYLCKGNSIDYSPNKIFLKYKDKYCLYPENLIGNKIFEIAADKCDKIAHENENKIVWLSFNDGRLKTQNGMCLKTYKNFLIISTCSPDKNEKSEIWIIDEEKRLKNENNICAQIAGDKLFSFICNELSTKEFEMKMYTLEEMNLMKTRYSQKKLQNVNTEYLENLHNKSNILISNYNELEKEIEIIIKEEEEIKKEKERMKNLMNDIKLLINTSSSLNDYGTGALMKVYDSNNIIKKKNLLRVPLEKLEINEETLNELGIENGEVKIIIQSFLNVPDSNYYTFVARNIKGNLIIKLDNEEIISNMDTQIDTSITSSLVYLSKNKLVPLYIEISSKEKKPSFTLYWSSKFLPEQVITSLYLYTTIYEKVCYTDIQKKVDCSSTFENIHKKNQEFHFLCPSDCFVKEKYTVYKKSNSCYELKSSICLSAIDSNFLPTDSGGIIKVMIKSVKSDEGNYKECGIILPTNMNDHTFKGITDIKLIDTDDFFNNYDKNREIYKGYKGIVTDDKHALLTKTDLSKRYISDIDINCHNNLKENYEFGSGSFVVTRIKSSNLTSDEKSVVVDAFALFDKYINEHIPVNLSDWTRKACNNIQLYVKYGKSNEVMKYPSMLLSCDDTFEDIQLDDDKVTIARCLPFCLNDKEVFGSYIYSPSSAICKSAIHSGIITYNGGLIEITKLRNITQSYNNTVSITRNGVKAIITNNKNTDSYYISKPNGSICNFPRTSYNVNKSLNIEDDFFSFIQINSKLFENPPVVLVSEKHAALQNQLYNMQNVYNTKNYKENFFLVENTKEELKEITPSDYNDEKLMEEFSRFQHTYKEQKEHIEKLTKKSQMIFSDLFSKKNAINNLNKKLSNIRIEQKSNDSFLKINKSAAFSLIKQFDMITKKKKYIIQRLEKSLSNIKPITIETFQENYDSININDNYIIKDSNRNINGPSNWKIEKYTNGNLFSSITDDSFIKSSEDLYGSYILCRYTKLYKGFISVDIKIPYEGNVGIIFKYKDHNNYNNFIISRKEFYFVEVINGKQSKKINQKKIDDSYNLGMWTKIYIDFGYKYIRSYLNEKYVNGYETKNDTSGLLGFGVNNCKDKIFIDKIVIGSLYEAKYYKNSVFDKIINKYYQKKTLEKENEKAENIKNNRKKNEKECKKYEEIFNVPLENNWIIPVNTYWNVENNFNTILNNNKNDDNYLYSIQKNKGNLVIPSIILLKKQNICDEIKSYTFQSSVNLKKLSKAGIIFRVLSSDDFLSVILDISELLGKIYLMKITKGIPYQLIAPTHIPIKHNVWFNLKIYYNGSNINITLNDEMVLNSKFNEYFDDLGNVGLIVLKGESKFKNIKFVPNNL